MRIDRAASSRSVRANRRQPHGVTSGYSWLARTLFMELARMRRRKYVGAHGERSSLISSRLPSADGRGRNLQDCSSVRRRVRNPVAETLSNQPSIQPWNRVESSPFLRWTFKLQEPQSLKLKDRQNVLERAPRHRKEACYHGDAKSSTHAAARSVWQLGTV